MELAKLISSIITPIVILFLGIWAKNIAKKHQKRISIDYRIIKKRIEIYDKIGCKLNDIFSFTVQVGNWKEITPMEIIQMKRDIDKIMHINRPYWTEIVFDKYSFFMEACFETWTGVGEDAKIKAETEKYKVLDKWNDSWESIFSNKEPDCKKIRDSYRNLQNAFSDQFGFFQE